MKLLFSRNPNPRLAVAAARYLKAEIAFEFASPTARGQAERYRALNPNLTLPILVGPGWSLWEADAIACWLSRDMHSDFWHTGDNEPEMIRWLSWGKENFVRACDMVHFERGSKQRWGLGPIDKALVEEGLRQFHMAAAILEAELSPREWLVGKSVSYADFRMATFLAFNDVARLPLDDYPSIRRWYGRLEAIDAWRDPFQGLEAPQLPPVRIEA
ncbi:glutathione S-transferase family protein [Mesorhizobium sp. M1E.F.Ca.ET.045.02.1.1]|uniref:glutathione S-transferase family protein n=1 Tax=unclassified Mesorhizobium TaxID=325217 RepID=UPI000F7639F6|nr:MULTISPECIES: glutathione S-transferase family protein [unclassified Mesorhizobium]AZO22178.1 glutathione S-transferase family protein [Mesorhizobium sp. M1E.F.Ca.ET.045.02.1.1]RUW83914.1 glutathione S-transferase family protein [Mesorhizobium sp. M1E.F.Ca.ET.063.01.1.1]